MQPSASTPHGHFASFADFYRYYLAEHTNLVCRRLHLLGTTLVIGFLLAAIVTGNPWLLLGMPLSGYSFAWIGHFWFERNRPATFSHPLYSLLADFVLFRDVLTGRIPF